MHRYFGLEVADRLLTTHGMYNVHKPSNTFRTKLIESNGPFDKMEQSALIYNIDCMNC